MAIKRSNIPGAVLTRSVVAEIAESLRGYTVRSLMETLDYTREMNAAAVREGRVASDGAFESDLMQVIQEGGRWILSSVRFVDRRGVEMSSVSSNGLDFDFVDEAVELGLTLTPYAAVGTGVSVQIDLAGSVVRLKVEAPEDLIVEMFDVAYDVLVATVPVETPSGPDSKPSRPFKVFVAYGGGRAWEVVRDYLRDAGFEVDAFTEDERAGQLTLDVVEQMIRTASVAVIVMTGADRMESGAIHARQNVVHEAGFAQGAIGRRNTIILREAGVTLPTNVDGLTYIEFARGEIHTTRERVVNLVARLKSQASP